MCSLSLFLSLSLSLSLSKKHQNRTLKCSIFGQSHVSWVNKIQQTEKFSKLYKEKSAYIYWTLWCDVQTKYFDGGQRSWPVAEPPV